MNYDDDPNVGEFFDNRDLFTQPDPESCPAFAAGQSQPSPLNDNSQPANVSPEPNECDLEEMIRKRKRTSTVWDHFKVEKIDIGGGNIEDRAVCKFCKLRSSCKSSNGTGHLNRHAKKGLEKLSSKFDPTQSQLTRSYGSVGTFKYSHAKMREGLAKLLVVEELPFSFADSRNFELFQKQFCQPEFKRVSRNTTKNDMLKVYKDEKKKLIKVFSDLKSSVAITSDLWSGGNNLPFMCVTAHYIDENWLLHKRIIAFRLLEFPHTGRILFNGLMEVFKEYNIVNKIFSVTFDNASNNISAIDQLKRCLPSPYGGELFHVKCACHIINLMVQDGMKRIGDLISCVRNAIGCVCSSDSRLQEFNHLCKSQGLKPRKFKKDMPIRWNSTYLMLKSCKGYTNALSVYYNDKNNQDILNDDVWNTCFKFHDFLQVFYDATCNCSGIYYPTSPIAINDLYAISITFDKYRYEYGVFGEIYEIMVAKYKKYWEDVPLIFCFGAILDPRIKLAGLDVILTEIRKILSIEIPVTISNIQKSFNDIYRLYEKKFAVINVQNPQASHRPCSSEGNISSSQVVFGLLASKTKQRGIVSACNEFFKYIDADFSDFMTDKEKNKLDLLEWWKSHSRNYPILSLMARDVLAAPVSTVASESAFSVGGRVLDEKRSKLTPTNLEAFMLVKDWNDADQRAQKFVDEDLAFDEEENTTTNPINLTS